MTAHKLNAVAHAQSEQINEIAPLNSVKDEKGLVITSIDPVKLMSTSLTREGEIICQVPNRGYWVTGMDVPPLEGEELAAFEKKYQRALKRKRA